MNPWWWLPIGLAIWCAAAVVVALLIGPVLGRGSRLRAGGDQEGQRS